MIDWFKVQATIATNAKIAAAGPDGALVFLATLCQHTHHGVNGRLPARRLAAAVLKIEAVALVGSLPIKRIERAIVLCLESDLLRQEGDEIVICGYDEESKPACVRCHAANDDHRFAVCPACREKRTAKLRRELGDAPANPPAVSAPQPVAIESPKVATGREQSRPGRHKSKRTGPDRTGPVPTPTPSTEGVGANPIRPKPETQSLKPAEPSAEPSAVDPAMQLLDRLIKTRYRAAIPEPKRRFVLRHEADRLAGTGLTPSAVDELEALAAALGKDPDGLFAHWLDDGLWREALDEQRCKAKEACLRQRPPSDVSLDGIYGCEPQPIAAVVLPLPKRIEA